MDIETNGNEPDHSSLNLDISVLMDRNGEVQHGAIMDRYGIRIFDTDVEAQIGRYRLIELDRDIFYKKAVLRRDRQTEDGELDTIRNEVFAVSYTPAGRAENSNELKGSQQNPGLIAAMCLLALVTGMIYGRHKRKEREKRLADFNDSYDE